jgi:hypothetical protein
MRTPHGTASRPATAVVVAAVVAGIAHLAVGYLYAASGLVVPAYAVIPLWIWWGVQAWALLRLAAARSWCVLAVPVVAAASWWLVLMAGGTLLDWTA